MYYSKNLDPCLHEQYPLVLLSHYIRWFCCNRMNCKTMSNPKVCWSRRLPILDLLHSSMNFLEALAAAPRYRKDLEKAINAWAGGPVRLHQLKQLGMCPVEQNNITFGLQLLAAIEAILMEIVLTAAGSDATMFLQVGSCVLRNYSYHVAGGQDEDVNLWPNLKKHLVLILRSLSRKHPSGIPNNHFWHGTKLRKHRAMFGEKMINWRTSQQLVAIKLPLPGPKLPWCRRNSTHLTPKKPPKKKQASTFSWAEFFLYHFFRCGMMFGIQHRSWKDFFGASTKVPYVLPPMDRRLQPARMRRSLTFHTLLGSMAMVFSRCSWLKFQRFNGHLQKYVRKTSQSVSHGQLTLAYLRNSQV